MRLLLLLGLLSACAARRAALASGATPHLELELPADWREVPPWTFARRVGELPEGGVTWSAAERAELAQALGEVGPNATRAAVLLARDESPEVTRLLLDRLLQHAPAPERALEGGDLVIAAALAGRGVEEQLIALASGPSPHPDLEVRVECARSALAAGREEVVPFLLTVLRALTPAERDHPADWPRMTTMMWPKSRAAEALSARLGIPCTFRPDGSWADQMAEADRLERLFEK